MLELWACAEVWCDFAWTLNFTESGSFQQDRVLPAVTRRWPYGCTQPALGCSSAEVPHHRSQQNCLIHHPTSAPHHHTRPSNPSKNPVHLSSPSRGASSTAYRAQGGLPMPLLRVLPSLQPHHLQGNTVSTTTRGTTTHRYNHTQVQSHAVQSHAVQSHPGTIARSTIARSTITCR